MPRPALKRLIATRGIDPIVPHTIQGLGVWYDTTDDRYLALAGTAITQFLDRSGNGLDTNVQGTGTQRPTKTLNAINGFQTAVFDGGDHLSAPLVAALMSGSDKAVTTFTVSSVTATNPTQHTFLWGQDVSNQPLYGERYGSDQRIVIKRDDASLLKTVSGGAPVANVFNITSTVNTGTTATTNLNGVEVISAGDIDVGTATLDNFTIGAGDRGGAVSQWITGSISEILIFNRILTAAEVTQVEVYLADKYRMYHPNATWFNFQEYTAEQISYIHALEMNFDDAFKDTTINTMAAWYDTSDSNYLTLVSTAISQILDKSGHANDSNVQATGTKRAVFTSDLMNGKSGAVYDGGDAYVVDDSGSLSITDDINIFMVGSCTNLTGTSRTYFSKDANASYRFRMDEAADTMWSLTSDGTFEIVESTSPITLGKKAVFTTAIEMGNEVRFREAGSSLGTVAKSDTTIDDTANALIIGGFDSAPTEAWLGDMIEIVLVKGFLTDTKINDIEVILADKYGAYHPNATWILDYTAEQQSYIHALKMNKDDAFQDTTANRMNLWLKADTDNLTLVSTAISQVLDASGHGNDSNVQATGTKRPTFDATGNNGFGQMDFDQGDILTIPASTTVNNIFATGATVYAVIQPDDHGGGGFGRIFDKAVSNNGAMVFFSGTTEAKLSTQMLQGFTIGDGQWDTATPALSIKRSQTVRVALDASSTANNPTMTVDGAAFGINESSSPSGVADDDSALDFIFGNRAAEDRGYDGKISELVIVNGVSSAAEALAIEVILADKYGMYHPSATWIDAYSASVQLMIHAGKLYEAHPFVQNSIVPFAWFATTDRDFLTTISSAITTMLDKSGNELDTDVQGTAASRPTFTDAQQDGWPGSVYDGDDILILPSDFYTLPAGNNTIIAVAKRDTEDASGGYIFAQSEAAAVRHVLRFSGNAGQIDFASNDDGVTLLNSGNTNTNYQIITAFRDGTTQSLSVDGDTAETDANGADEVGIDAATIGAFTTAIVDLNGGILELIILDSAASAADITIIEEMLEAKYNITLL